MPIGPTPPLHAAFTALGDHRIKARPTSREVMAMTQHRRYYEVRKRTAAGRLRSVRFSSRGEALRFADLLVSEMAARGATGSVRIMWPEAEDVLYENEIARPEESHARLRG
jgi:hypothetical protein